MNYLERNLSAIYSYLDSNKKLIKRLFKRIAGLKETVNNLDTKVDGYDERITTNSEHIEDLEGSLDNVVTFDDVATTNSLGVIKTGNGTYVSSSTQRLIANVYNYDSWDTISVNYFISKGTLENVLNRTDRPRLDALESGIDDTSLEIENINNYLIEPVKLVGANSAAMNIAANSFASVNVTVDVPEGYKAIGVNKFFVNGGQGESWAYPYKVSRAGNTVSVAVRNLYTGGAIQPVIRVILICMKEWSA